MCVPGSRYRETGTANTKALEYLRRLIIGAPAGPAGCASCLAAGCEVDLVDDNFHRAGTGAVAQIQHDPRRKLSFHNYAI